MEFNKASQLNSPGVRTTDVLIRNPLETQVSQVEVTRNFGNIRVTGSSKNTSSTSAFHLGSSEVISTVILSMKITVPPEKPNVVSGNGWGYSIINAIWYSIGAMQNPPQSISGHGIMLFNSLCSSAFGRQQHFELGGEPINGPGTYKASVLIPLPFSAFFGYMKREQVLPFDSRHTTISINVQFGGPTSAMSGVDANSILEFASLDIFAATLTLSDQSMSPYSLIRNTPGAEIDVPYTFPQMQRAIVRVDSTDVDKTISLTGTLNADMRLLAFMVVPERHVSWANSPSRIIQPFAAERLESASLAVNGAVLYSFDNTSAANLLELSESGAQNHVFVKQPVGTTAPTLYSQRKCPWYVWTVSNIRETFSGKVMPNTRRFPSSIITLSFRLNSEALATPGVAENFYIYYMMLYNSLISIEGSGATKITM